MNCHILQADTGLEEAEWIERRALESLTRAPSGPASIEVGPAHVSFSRSDPSILFNRVQGLGVAQMTTLEQIRAVMSTYADRRVKNYFVHLYRSRTRGSDEELREIGLERARAWRKFSHDLTSDPPVRSDLTVRQLKLGESRELRAFGEIVSGAFDLREASVSIFEALVEDPRWNLFMSFDGEACAGAGALFVEAHPRSGRLMGYFDIGATHPDFRRRGSQSAVIGARIARARALGCVRVVTSTGEAVPGDPQHSYRNLVRSGFRDGPLRENWRPVRL